MQTINGNQNVGSPMSSTADLHRRVSMSAFGDGQKEAGTTTDGSEVHQRGVIYDIVDGDVQESGEVEKQKPITSSVSMGSMLSTRGRESDLEVALRVSRPPLSFTRSLKSRLSSGNICFRQSQPNTAARSDADASFKHTARKQYATRQRKD
jgi:hypothetical protein